MCLVGACEFWVRTPKGGYACIEYSEIGLGNILNAHGRVPEDYAYCLLLQSEGLCDGIVTAQSRESGEALRIVAEMCPA